MRLVRLVAKRLIVFLFIPNLAWAEGLPDLGEPARHAFSSEQERSAGEEIMREIRKSRLLFDDPELLDYLNNLGYKLVSNLEGRQSFEFFVIQDASVNAFALPGGFIGVHTGLFLLAQSESELAAVLAHEIAHVNQHHLARLIERQNQTAITSLAALAISILMARAHPQMAEAGVATTQALSIQAGLNYTREFEKEADRLGLQTLTQAGFDPSAMPRFFERLQKANRLYEIAAPEYLRTHPLTYERIADIENRLNATPVRPVIEGLNFKLLREKIRAQQNPLKETRDYFVHALQNEKDAAKQIPDRYGLSQVLLRMKELKQADQELSRLRQQVTHPAIELLASEVKLAAGELKKAEEILRLALKNFPDYRALAYGYIEILMKNQQVNEALKIINNRLQQYPDEYLLYGLQAKAYAILGNSLLKHKAQAEYYAKQDNLPAAIEQLQMALRSKGGDFYQLSIIEARLKELTAKSREK